MITQNLMKKLDFGSLPNQENIIILHDEIKGLKINNVIERMIFNTLKSLNSNPLNCLVLTLYPTDQEDKKLLTIAGNHERYEFIIDYAQWDQEIINEVTPNIINDPNTDLIAQLDYSTIYKLIFNPTMKKEGDKLVLFDKETQTLTSYYCDDQYCIAIAKVKDKYKIENSLYLRMTWLEWIFSSGRRYTDRRKSKNININVYINTYYDKYNEDERCRIIFYDTKNETIIAESYELRIKDKDKLILENDTELFQEKRKAIKPYLDCIDEGYQIPLVAIAPVKDEYTKETYLKQSNIRFYEYIIEDEKGTFGRTVKFDSPLFVNNERGEVTGDFKFPYKAIANFYKAKFELCYSSYNHNVLIGKKDNYYIMTLALLPYIKNDPYAKRGQRVSRVYKTFDTIEYQYTN